jgi:hypothetical protein
MGNSRAQEMAMSILYVGLDVHNEMIVVALAEEGRTGEVRPHGTIEHTPSNVTNLIGRLEKTGKQLYFCYEAGCCGYGLQRKIIQAFDCAF